MVLNLSAEAVRTALAKLDRRGVVERGHTQEGDEEAILNPTALQGPKHGTEAVATNIATSQPIMGRAACLPSCRTPVPASVTSRTIKCLPCLGFHGLGRWSRIPWQQVGTSGQQHTQRSRPITFPPSTSRVGC